MASLRAAFDEFAEVLRDRYGRAVANGRETESAFRRMLRVVSTRTIAGPRADALLDALAEAELLGPETLAESDPAEAAQVVEAAGVSRPTKHLLPLRRLAAWLAGRGGVDTLDEAHTETLRDELRAVKGIGPTTADAILLLALGRAAFPLDRPAYRVLLRHGWLDASTEYDEARAMVESVAPDDPAALADLTEWLDRLAAEFCKPAAPRCERCPLRPWLPESGPIDLEP